MSEAIFSKNEKLEQARLKRQYIATLITVAGSATLANVVISSDLGNAVQPYWEAVSGVQPLTPLDTGATFATLDSEAAPSSMGILIMCGDAKVCPFKPRVTNITSGTMTAGVVTLAGASTSGVTVPNTIVGGLGGRNLAFSISCTALNFQAAATSTFLLEAWYDAF